MYALIREYKNLDPTMRENVTRKASNELRPILSKTQGFVSYELLTPQDDQNAVTSISVFATKADAEASITVAQDWVQSNLPEMTKPHSVAGELVAH